MTKLARILAKGVGILGLIVLLSFNVDVLSGSQATVTPEVAKAEGLCAAAYEVCLWYEMPGQGWQPEYGKSIVITPE